MHRLRDRLTYANVVATLALIVAIAGGSTAIAITASKNSVTTKSIRNGNVTARDLGKLRQVAVTAPVSGSPGGAQATARCPKGARVISGGVAGGDVQGSEPVRGGRLEGWNGGILSESGPTARVRVVAICLLRKP